MLNKTRTKPDWTCMKLWYTKSWPGHFETITLYNSLLYYLSKNCICENGISSLQGSSRLVEVLFHGRELSISDLGLDILCPQFPFSVIRIRTLPHSELWSRAPPSAIP